MFNRYIKSVYLKKQIDSCSYLNNIPAIDFLIKNKTLSFSKNVTFFVGENGTGKSTLIEAIAVAYGFNPEGGTKNFNFSTNSSHSDLWEHIALAKTGFAKDGFFLRAESFYNVASNIEELYEEELRRGLEIPYGKDSLHNQSHGESFLSLVQNRFNGNGLYILDEPEAALSPMRQLTLIAQMDSLVKNNSQFIVATHSPILMAFPGAEIFEFNGCGIKSVDYRDTEHYRVTKRFLENPEKMLRYLLDD